MRSVSRSLPINRTTHKTVHCPTLSPYSTVRTGGPHSLPLPDQFPLPVFVGDYRVDITFDKVRFVKCM